MPKKKILIDLDVVTIAIWDKNKSAVDFIGRIKAGEFEVYTPYSLFDLLDKWKFENLRDKIKEFYELNSTEIITSLFNLDFLITLNRRHLKNKKEVINDVLRKYKLRTISIVSPDEI